MPHGSADCGPQAARRPRPQAPRPGRAPWPSPSPGPARPQVWPPFLAGLSFLRSHIQVKHAAFVPVWRGRPRGCRRRGARPPGGCAASGGDCVLITRLRLAEETAAWTCGQLSDRAPSRRPGVMSFRRTPRGGPARPEADPFRVPAEPAHSVPRGCPPRPAGSRRLSPLRRQPPTAVRGHLIAAVSCIPLTGANTFPRTCWPFLRLLWKMIVQVLCPFPAELLFKTEVWSPRGTLAMTPPSSA